MAQALREVPVKKCLMCGNEIKRKKFRNRLEDRGVFLRKKFCSISCGTKHQHLTNPPTVAASRKQAHKLCEEQCEICGSTTNVAAHHADQNPLNNKPDNLQTLCDSCHGFWHAVTKRAGIHPAGRMPQLFIRAYMETEGTK